MKITIESTSEFVGIARAGAPDLQCRVWQGTTEAGVKVQCLIARVAALETEDLSQFERELEETARPLPVLPRAFPLRMIL